MGIMKKFQKEFGESLDEFEDGILVAVSAPRIEALVDLVKFQERFNVVFHTFSFDLPKKVKGKWEAIRFNNQWFDLLRIRRYIDLFLEGTIEANTFVEQETLLVIKISQEYGIVLAPKQADRHKCYPSYWELEYEWDDIFHEQTFGSDMIL
jgi:hypothetical protein